MKNAICYIVSDNSEAKKIQGVIDYLSEDCNLNILSKKAYGDFWSECLKGWKDTCLEHNIIPIFTVQ